MPSSAFRRRAALRVGALTLAGAALAAPVSAQASAATAGADPTTSPSAERALATALRHERAAQHLPALAPASDLTKVARAWAVQMATAHQVAQNPQLREQAGDWVALGENVGMGPDPASVDRAFLTSAAHRANIFASDYTQVAIGVAVAADGTLFVVEDFRRPASAPAPTSRPPATAPAPRAVPVPQPARPATAAPAGSARAAASAVAPPARQTLANRVAALTAVPAPQVDPLTGAARFARSLASLSATRQP